MNDRTVQPVWKWLNYDGKEQPARGVGELLRRYVEKQSEDEKEQKAKPEGKDIVGDKDKVNANSGVEDNAHANQSGEKKNKNTKTSGEAAEADAELLVGSATTRSAAAEEIDHEAEVEDFMNEFEAMG